MYALSKPEEVNRGKHIELELETGYFACFSISMS